MIELFLLCLAGLSIFLLMELDIVNKGTPGMKGLAVWNFYWRKNKFAIIYTVITAIVMSYLLYFGSLDKFLGLFFGESIDAGNYRLSAFLLGMFSSIIAIWLRKRFRPVPLSPTTYLPDQIKQEKENG